MNYSRKGGEADSKTRSSLIGISDSQLYKQAGNSIIAQVLMAIFGEYYNVPWKEKVYSERYKHGQSQYADLPIMMEENNGLF